MRVTRLALIMALALAASGCGAAKKSGSIPAGAEFAPTGSALYVAITTDPSSDQWRKADRLLSKFPGRAKFLAMITKELTKEHLSWKRDVKPALPDAVHLVLVDFTHGGDDLIGYAKPKDEAKFNKLIGSGDDPAVHRKIDGWTVFSDKQVFIDRFVAARSKGSLTEDKTFKDAIETEPKDAAVRGYVSGSAINAAIEKSLATSSDAENFRKFSDAFGKLESVSFSASAEDQGLSVQASYSTDPAQKISNFSPSLDDRLPAGALLYVSFGNLEDLLNTFVERLDEAIPNFGQQRKQFEDALGFTLKDDLFPLFSKEGALAIYRGGELVPGVFFALRVPDEKKAQHVVDRLAALAALGGGSPTRKIKVHGVATTEFILQGQLSIFAAVHDGNAYVTNSKEELEVALGGGKKLSDDPVYKDVRDAAGAPGETAGFVYVNLKDGLPYVFDFADMDGRAGSISPEVRANTKPLQAAFLYGKRDGNRIILSGFVTIK